jgi:hypothetical protein
MTAMVGHNARSYRPPSVKGFKTADVVAAMSGDASDARLWEQLYSEAEASAAVGRCKNLAYVTHTC